MSAPESGLEGAMQMFSKMPLRVHQNAPFQAKNFNFF